MMNTALVMAGAGEQTTMRSSATSDRVVSGEMTFAQSFGERAGVAVNAQTMNGATVASSDTQEGRTSGLVKNFDAPSVPSTVVKANTVADQRLTKLDATTSMTMTAGSGRSKSVAGETDLVALANVRRQSKTTVGQLPADLAELQQDIGSKEVAQAVVSQRKTAGADVVFGNNGQPGGNLKDIEPSAVASNVAPAAEATAVDLLARESSTLTDRPLLPRDEVELTLQNKAVLAGKTLVVASTKNDPKTEENAGGEKAASKLARMTESAKVIGDPSIITGVQGAILLHTQVAAPSDAQPNAVGVTAANVSWVPGASAAIRDAGTSLVGTNNAARKANVRTGTDEVEATGHGVNPVAGATAATGFVTEIDKVASVAGKDADAKALSAIGATAALVHTATGNEAVASGTIAGMTSGHAPAEISGTKAKAGEAGAHAATPEAGLEEQDGSGAGTAEMGMSHRTLLATPMALEVGLANGTQGWLKIRAEMTDGGIVNASLSSATSAGQEMLHRELPALTAYLQEERVAVSTVIVPATAAAGTDSRFAGGMEREGNGQAQPGSRQGAAEDGQGSIHRSADRTDEIPMYMTSNGVGEDGFLSAGTYAGGGSWLNVRA